MRFNPEIGVSKNEPHYLGAGHQPVPGNVRALPLLEAPYKSDYLARPAKVRPNLAEAMP